MQCFCGKSSISGGFSIVAFDYQIVTHLPSRKGKFWTSNTAHVICWGLGLKLACLKCNHSQLQNSEAVDHHLWRCYRSWLNMVGPRLDAWMAIPIGEQVLAKIMLGTRWWLQFCGILSVVAPNAFKCCCIFHPSISKQSGAKLIHKGRICRIMYIIIQF